MKKSLPNQRLEDIFSILNDAPVGGTKTCLDVGMGDGSVTKWFSKKGLQCTGTSLDKIFIKKNLIRFNKKYQIKIVRCDAEKIPLPNQSFEIILMSHVLEHCQNIGLVLQEARRLLTDSGWLLLFVPPYDPTIYAGHVTTGWNIGQLIYILGLNGFDARNGRFIKYGYNICGFVQKNQLKRLSLNHDQGDIKLLKASGVLPLLGDQEDSYFGEINSWNWPESSKLIRHLRSNFKYRICTRSLSRLSKLLPFYLKEVFGSVLILIGNIIKYDNNYRAVNPKTMRG